MLDPQSLTSAQTRPLVFTMPPVLDAATAVRLGEELEAALVPGVGTVVADLTLTTRCDPPGARMLARAQRRAIEADTELRLAGPCPDVLEVLKLTGLDRMLPIYPGLEQALTAEPLPDLLDD